MPWPDTHRHVTQTVLSGVTYARIVAILSPYTVEFEDGQYAVRTTGANHNILDVKIANQVSLLTQNSAGLIVSGSGVTAQDKIDIVNGVWNEAQAGHVVAGSFGSLLDGPVSASGLTAAQATMLTEINRLLGLDAAFVVEHGETYIRAPADGSVININVTRTGPKLIPQPKIPSTIHLPAPLVLVREAGGGFSAGWFQGLQEQAEEALVEVVLIKLAEQIAELACTPEIQTWTSAVLSQAGRRGEDLSTERRIAETVLRAAQHERGNRPLLETARLGASFVSLGLNTALVAHGELVFSRAIMIVEADKKWLYADPHGTLPLGTSEPFVIERFYKIPVVIDADELCSIREQLQKLQKEWLAHVANFNFKTSTAPTTRIIVIESQVNWTRVLVTGIAIGVAATALVWLLTEASRDRDDD